jgi:phosphonate degradation associated HDIG domain protein
VTEADPGATVPAVTAVVDLFDRRGGWRYAEVVTQLEHALQVAWLADEAGADDPLVVAALVHDVGHLVVPDLLDHDARHREVPDGAGQPVAVEASDAHHEEIGAGWLARWFPPAVTEPVRLHVAAKRYLCRVEPAYASSLSAASRRSLAVQGGPMSGAEAADFAVRAGADEAVRLRRWDDAGKVPGVEPPPLSAYGGRLATLAIAGSWPPPPPP